MSLGNTSLHKNNTFTSPGWIDIFKLLQLTRQNAGARRFDLDMVIILQEKYEKTTQVFIFIKMKKNISFFSLSVSAN